MTTNAEISSQTENTSASAGQAGNLNLTLNRLNLTDGGRISHRTLSPSNTGSTTINANQINIDGTNADNFTGISSEAGNPDNTITGSGGDLNLTTNRLSLTNSGRISANTFGIGNAGNMTIIAESIEIDGLNANDFTGISSETSNVEAEAGEGGNINLSTNRLSLTNGGRISANTFGEGNAGNMTIIAESIEINDFGNNGFTGISSESGTPGPDNTATGDGGNLNLVTNDLSLSNGGRISSSASGDGKAGNITVNANQIEIDGFDIDLENGEARPVNSGIRSEASTGRGGDVTLNTNQLNLSNEGGISVSTGGTGNAGNITISAETVNIQSSGKIQSEARPPFNTSTEALSGTGGNITVDTHQLNLTDSSEISVSTDGTGNAGEITIFAEVANIQSNASISSEARRSSTGIGGDIMLSIDDTLNVIDRGQISSSSEGEGNAGNITINANQLQINQAGITATSEQTGGGDITLTTDALNLQNGEISTTVFDSFGGGGDIEIDVENGLIVAQDNSSIEANAFAGPGGNINIVTQGIFLLGNSTITASSELGVDGVIEINQLATDPSQGLIELSTDVIDPNQLIANSCLSPSRRQQGRFVITGAGGLPPQPNDLSNIPFHTFSVELEADSSDSTPQNPKRSIALFQGVYQLENGRFVLGWECPE